MYARIIPFSQTEASDSVSVLVRVLFLSKTLTKLQKYSLKCKQFHKKMNEKIPHTNLLSFITLLNKGVNLYLSNHSRSL